MRSVTFYHVRQIRGFRLYGWAVLRCTETWEGGSLSATDDVLISRHIFYVEAATRSGKLNQRRLQREQITRKG